MRSGATVAPRTSGRRAAGWPSGEAFDPEAERAAAVALDGEGRLVRIGFAGAEQLRLQLVAPEAIAIGPAALQGAARVARVAPGGSRSAPRAGGAPA